MCKYEAIYWLWPCKYEKKKKKLLVKRKVERVKVINEKQNCRLKN